MVAASGACPAGPTGCPGHDEPGLQFYSTTPGSGGNVSWTLSLPVERSAALNQSSLYSAAFLGLTLSDPYGWLGECLVEVQFYPDQSYYNPTPAHPTRTMAGSWVGAVVGWQFDLATGAEDACFYQPLYLNGNPGPAFLNMTQGDRLNLTATGWPSSSTGELISVKDSTNGRSSSVTLFNKTGNYPLDPVYGTNAYQNAVLWHAGGEYPIFFAFEIGQSINGVWPTNNSFGGCSPGTAASPSDPSAPCPSYDPGAWANDTQTPWKISLPVFFNAHARTKPTQVAFSQTTGGPGGVGAMSGGACTGRTGSAGCSYPWFSYSCQASAFEFGAADFPGAATDFGKLKEYNPAVEQNALGRTFFAPKNFTVPICGTTSYTVTTHARGSSTPAIFFMGQALRGEQNVSGVIPGNYSAGAINAPGFHFEFWDPVGNISVANTGDPWTTVTVSGNGVLVAFFNNNPPNATRVTFADAPSGSIAVDPATTFAGPVGGTGNSLGTFTSGGRATLYPGLYTIEALPVPGANFSSWSTNNTGASVVAPNLPATWLMVTSLARSVTLTAQYTTTTAQASVRLVVQGNGTATIGSFSVTNSGSGSATGSTLLSRGGYGLTATLGTGATGVGWSSTPGATIGNYSAQTNVSVQGTATITATFSSAASVTFVANPSTAGSISFLGPGGVGAALANNTMVRLLPGTYQLQANAKTGSGFGGWTASGSATLSTTASPVTTLTVLGTATVTAAFPKSSHTVTVKVGSLPSTSGSLLWDGGSSFTNLSSIKPVAVGLHTVTAVALPGWAFSGWNISGKIVGVGSSVGIGEVLNVSAAGQVQALFTAVASPVTFVVVSPSTALPTTTTLTVNGVVLHTGTTTWLVTGSYTVKLGPNITAVQLWTTTSNLTVTSPSNGSATVAVAGSGTIYVIPAAGHGPIAPAESLRGPGPALSLGGGAALRSSAIGATVRRP